MGHIKILSSKWFEYLTDVEITLIEKLGLELAKNDLHFYKV